MEIVKLNPYLHYDMAILFVPLNPPSISNSNGHYFSRIGTFWDILKDSGLITKNISNLIKADEIVFKDNLINYKNLKYGITDLVQIVETDSNKVSPKQNDVLRILEIVNLYKPEIICLMHSKVINAFSKAGIIPPKLDYGRVGEYKGSKIFTVPFPSGSSIPKERITSYYRLIRHDIDKMQV